MKFSNFDFEIGRLLVPWKFEDYCPNGCLVDPFQDGDREVSTVVTGVSLCDDLIAKAIKAKADVLVVHHPNGFWKSEKDKRLVGTFGRYMCHLVRAGIALYGFHLPLDAHWPLGNNYQIAIALGTPPNEQTWPEERIIPFMEQEIGVVASCRVNKTILNRVFPKGWMSFGPAIEDKDYVVGICSGSGTSALQDAIDSGCTMFITGEVRESTPIFAKENSLTVVAAGHHRTEVFGMRALAKFITADNEKFAGVKAKFIDIDNPI